MFKIIKDLSKPLVVNDKKKLLYISLILSLSILFESLSIGILIPVFKLILDQNQAYNFFIEYFPYTINWITSVNFSNLLILMVCCIFIFKFLVVIFLNYCLYNFGFSLHNRLTNVILIKLTNLNLEDFSKTHTSKATKLFATEIDQFVGCCVALLILINELLVICALVIIMFLLNFTYTLLILSIFLISFLSYNFFLKNKIINLGIVRSKYEGLKFRYLLEYFNNYFEISAYDKIKHFQYRFTSSSILRNYSFKWLRIYQNMPRIFFEFYVLIIFIFTAFYAVALEIKVESFILIGGIYAVCAFRMVPSFNKTIQSIQTLKFLKPTIKSINNVLKVNHKLINLEKLDFKNKIQLKNIDFKYKTSNEYVFRKANILIKKNEKIAIIGSSGKGKSTLLNILLGYLKPIRGSIFIDNHIVLKKNYHRFKVGYLPQNPTLLDENLKENIIFGRKFFNNEFNRVIKICNLSKLSDKNDNSRNRTLGERGKSVSGGQRQRIMLARALYENPDIVIFDEFSSSLDSKNEIEILNNLKKVLKNKTAIFITHSKNVENFCNKVFSIENNRIKKIK